MISQERAKEIFVALRLHFQGKYDFIKYGGKMKSAKLKPNELYHVQKLTFRYQDEETLTEFFAVNMTENYLRKGKIDSFLPSYASKDYFEAYEKWKAWWNAFHYNLQNDLNTLSPDVTLKSLIETKGEHPLVFTAFVDERISFQTFVSISFAAKGILDYWKKNCDDTLFFGNYIQLVENYRVFIKKDPISIQKAISKYFKENSI